MAKRWKYWEVGYYSARGNWVKITTIFAPSEESARTKGHTALCRPGRHVEYRRWRDGGCEVLEC